MWEILKYQMREMIIFEHNKILFLANGELQWWQSQKKCLNMKVKLDNKSRKFKKIKSIISLKESIEVLLVAFVSQDKQYFKGFVCYIFASLFCMSKKEHFQKKKKCFSFLFKSPFPSWDNQILTFQIFKCLDIIKYLSMKHKTHFTE